MRFFMMQEESSRNCADFYLISEYQVIITEMYIKILPVVAKSVAKSETKWNFLVRYRKNIVKNHAQGTRNSQFPVFRFNRLPQLS
jgi:hypothetical protein